jgi:hypothetical protein
MPLARVLIALDIPIDASDEAIAAQLRTMLGCASPVSPRPQLWIRLLDALSSEVRRHPSLQTRDAGHLTDALALWCVSPSDEVRWTTEAWEEELGLTPVDLGLSPEDERRERWATAHNHVGGFIDDLLPRLVEAGLTRAVG